MQRKIILGLSIFSLFACKSRNFNSESNSIGKKSQPELSLVILPTAMLNFNSSRSKANINIKRVNNEQWGRKDKSLAAKAIMTSIYCGYELNSKNESVVTISNSPFEWMRLAARTSTHYRNWDKKIDFGNRKSLYQQIFTDNEPDSAPVLILSKIGSPDSDSTIDEQDYDFLRSTLRSIGVDSGETWDKNKEIQERCPSLDFKTLKTAGIEQSEQGNEKLGDNEKTIKMVFVGPKTQIGTNPAMDMSKLAQKFDLEVYVGKGQEKEVIAKSGLWMAVVGKTEDIAKFEADLESKEVDKKE